MFDEKTLAEREGDAAILALFREWCEAKRRHAAAPNEQEASAAFGHSSAIEDQIIASPSSGAAGIALKAYLFVHLYESKYRDDLAALPTPEEDGSLGTCIEQSIIRDAVRFVPELAPLAADYIKTPMGSPAQPGDAEKAALRKCVDAFRGLAAEYPVDDLPSGDAGLIEAERRLAELRAREKGLLDQFRAFITLETEEEILGSIQAAYYALEDIIEERPPESLAGAAVKLRYLAAFPSCRNDIPEEIINQVLPVVERKIAASRGEAG